VVPEGHRRMSKFLERRPLALHPDGFRERMLSERLRSACPMKFLLAIQPNQPIPLFLHRVLCHVRRGRISEVGLVANGCAKDLVHL
jgi:hypothetical protein